MFSRHVFITLLMILYAGAGPATAEEIAEALNMNENEIEAHLQLGYRHISLDSPFT